MRKEKCPPPSCRSFASYHGVGYGGNSNIRSICQAAGIGFQIYATKEGPCFSIPPFSARRWKDSGNRHRCPVPALIRPNEVATNSERLGAGIRTGSIVKGPATGAHSNSKNYKKKHQSYELYQFLQNLAHLVKTNTPPWCMNSTELQY